MRTALLLTLCLLSNIAFAGDGDIETETSTYAPRPSAALMNSGEKVARITVQRLCDGKGSGGAGAITCGPIWVPGGGVDYCTEVIRPIEGSSSAGCGYDDLKIYTIQPKLVAGVWTCPTTGELPILGVLDDDGTSTPSGGVQQIMTITSGGVPGPCLYAAGSTTAGGGALVCDLTHTMTVVVDYYPCLTGHK